MSALWFSRFAALAAMAFSSAAGAQASKTEVLARYPHGSYLENMLAEDDGSILVTNYFARRIERWSPGKGASTLLEIPQFPVSLAPFGDRILVVVHTVTFDKIAGTTDANRVLVMNSAGAVERSFTVGNAQFLNGIESLGGSRFLIADSVAGVIWSLNADSGMAARWLAGEVLTKLPGSTSPNPGVNGVHRGPDGWVYVSNSERKALYRVRMDAGGAAVGAIETVIDGLPGIDDFAFAPDGSIIIATHQHEIMRLSPDRTLVTLTKDEAVAGATAVVAGRGASQGAYFITGTGGLFEGGKGEAALVRLQLPH
jgi:sugar lactone lactonase YvrE